MSEPALGAGVQAPDTAAGPDSCPSCEHACWRGNRVVQCMALGTESSRIAQVLHTLLFALAQERPCPAHAPWEPQPDAYFSQDLDTDHDHPTSHSD